MNPIELLYSIAAEKPAAGQQQGVCRITGKQATGHNFAKWVRNTFSGYSDLYEGDIISNEAAFCFAELSEVMQRKTGRDKPQSFRTYSHIITADNNWLCLTKADRPAILQLLQQQPKVVCITEDGQKHLYYKNRTGFWQLGNMHMKPEPELLQEMHSYMMHCIDEGLKQINIIEISLNGTHIKKLGIERCLEIKSKLQAYRQKNLKIFQLATFLLYYK